MSYGLLVESNFSTTAISRSNSTVSFLLLKNLELEPLRMNVRMISAVYHNNLMAIYLSDHCMGIRSSEIEFQSYFSNFRFNSYNTFLIAEKDL